MILEKFIVFLYRLVNLYLYYIVGACILSLVPNINPNYPLFNCIFKIAGFYLIPPVFGFSFSPMFIMVLLVLFSMMLLKIYDKIQKEKPPVIILSPQDIFENPEKTSVEILKNLSDNSEQENNSKGIKSESEENK